LRGECQIDHINPGCDLAEVCSHGRERAAKLAVLSHVKQVEVVQQRAGLMSAVPAVPGSLKHHIFLTISDLIIMY